VRGLPAPLLQAMSGRLAGPCLGACVGVEVQFLMNDLQLWRVDTKKLTHAGRGMLAGLSIGAGLGVVIGAAVHNMALLPILAILVGPSGFVGLCIGAMKDRAQREREGGDRTG
jgi:hypothetical protein